MNNNKIVLNFLIRILGFLFFSIIMYLFYLILWGSLFPNLITKNLQFRIGAYGHLYSRLQEADTIRNTDILFMGSSHSYRGYDPRIFKQNNLSIMNLGSSAQPPKVTELLLKRYLLKIKPRLVVIDVFPHVFTIDGAESELDYLSNSKPDIENFELALASKNIKVINTYLYSFFYNSVGLFNRYNEERVKRYNIYNPKEYDTYIPGGYVQTSQSHFDSTPITFPNQKVELSGDNLRAFENMIEYLKANNIKYILVQTPITRKYYRSFTNNKELNAKFSTYGTYYDFNEIMNLPDTYFYDSNHLNKAGVEAYNKEFIKLLIKDSVYISTIK